MTIIWTDYFRPKRTSPWSLTVCCCFWLEAQCRRPVPVEPDVFWRWWRVSRATGTPIHTLLALFDHREEQSVERTASIKQNVQYHIEMKCFYELRDARLLDYRTNLTPVIPGGQDSFLQRLGHSLSQEHTPEHQPQPINLGAVRHMAQVRKCWQPGPLWGTWIIWSRDKHFSG